jgi:CheY-like chemotaxis protein/HPt (histidine-containing phosphotransfer) domain-containing protein
MKQLKKKEAEKSPLPVYLQSNMNGNLDTSKQEERKAEASRNPALVQVHLPALSRYMRRKFEARARQKNIQFQIETDAATEYICTRGEGLYQMVENLISNALESTNKGKVMLKIHLEEGESETLAIAEVSDTGGGLSPSDQMYVRKLLESRNPEAAFDDKRGGMALLETRTIACNMKGRLDFSSLVGSGSAFWIEIPIQKIEKSILEKDIRKNLKSGYVIPEVLLVDDNAVNLKLASALLSGAGCVVNIATNGEEALDRVKSGFFHLILMDIQMPLMNGVEAARAIKNLDLSYQPAIVAMTVLSGKEDKMRFLEAGMDDYIAKPVSGEKLLFKTRYWSEKRAGTSVLTSRQSRNKSTGPVLETQISTLEKNFDMEVIRNLHHHLGEEILIECLIEFGSDTQAMMKQMEMAFLVRDEEAMRKLAHTISGNAGTFGAKRLFALAKAMDNDLKINKLAALCGEQIDELRRAGEEFFESLFLLQTNHEWKN